MDRISSILSLSLIKLYYVTGINYQFSRLTSSISQYLNSHIITYLAILG